MWKQWPVNLASVSPPLLLATLLKFHGCRKLVQNFPDLTWIGNEMHAPIWPRYGQVGPRLSPDRQSGIRIRPLPARALHALFRAATFGPDRGHGEISGRTKVTKWLINKPFRDIFQDFLNLLEHCAHYALSRTNLPSFREKKQGLFFRKKAAYIFQGGHWTRKTRKCQ